MSQCFHTHPRCTWHTLARVPEALRVLAHKQAARRVLDHGADLGNVVPVFADRRHAEMAVRGRVVNNLDAIKPGCTQE
jgi:hypothetical protein